MLDLTRGLSGQLCFTWERSGVPSSSSACLIATLASMAKPVNVPRVLLEGGSRQVCVCELGSVSEAPRRDSPMMARSRRARADARSLNARLRRNDHAERHASSGVPSALRQGCGHEDWPSRATYVINGYNDSRCDSTCLRRSGQLRPCSSACVPSFHPLTSAPAAAWLICERLVSNLPKPFIA